MPAYFLVSIPKAEQTERREKIGSIYLHPNFVYMTRGMQCGQIVMIGRDAAEALPEAQVGQTLLFHHFVESTEKNFCVYSDTYFNYYVVTCRSHNGQNNQTYGVYTGTRIVPHPGYIFLHTEAAESKSFTPEEYIDDAITKSRSGLYLFKNWKIDREKKQEQIKEIKSQIDELTKTRMNDQIVRRIQELEAEMNHLSAELQQQRFEPFTVAAVHSAFSEEVEERYGFPVRENDAVYMLNIACQTKMEFNKTEYIVAKSAHFGLPAGWLEAHLNKAPAL